MENRFCGRKMFFLVLMSTLLLSRVGFAMDLGRLPEPRESNRTVQTDNPFHSDAAAQSERWESHKTAGICDKELTPMARCRCYSMILFPLMLAINARGMPDCKPEYLGP